MTHRVMNFGAGPAALPESVLEEVREEFLSLNGCGMSIVEVSHRSAAYDAVHEEAKNRLKRLLKIDDSYDVLFCAGGATTQFSLVAQNLLGAGKHADYMLTGSWAKKAFKEAKAYGEVRSAASSEDQAFSYIPKPAAWTLSDNASYLHITTNNTIYGTQWFDYPDVAVPLVADMSSDILWRDYAGLFSRFSLAYAGAQKNLGPAGVTIVVLRKALLDACRTDLSGMHSYRVQAENKSLYNTPPCFAIYMVNKVLGWIDAQGGPSVMETRNRQKAARLYGVIDAKQGFYRAPAAADSRSLMNVVFRLPTEALEATFLDAAKKQGMVGLKGHRSVGGMRASIYNAVPPAWVEALAQFMETFAQQNG